MKVDDMKAESTTSRPPLEERWVIVRETLVDLGDGKPELGYAAIYGLGTFDTEERARMVHRGVELPLGWVIMPVKQLLRESETWRIL